jgi:uridine kinase
MREHPEFVRRREREQTHVAKSPDLLDVFRPQANPFHSVYLSHPDDEESLRVRAEYGPDGVRYTAALKYEGEMFDQALERPEIPVPDLSEAAFRFYESHGDFPDVKYLRAEPLAGLAIDFIDGRELPQVEYESERGQEEPSFVSVLKGGLDDHSDSPEVRKEFIAHQNFGRETLKPSGESNEAFVNRVMNRMVATYALGGKQVITGISGMSGSGKSTIVKQLAEKIAETFGEEYRPLIVSTDDYHRGKKWLEATYGAPWTNWDDPRVYDTAALADDLKLLADGQPIIRKHFDFASEEVVEDGIASPSPFVIVEGLYAGSPDLKDVRNLHFEVPTSLATSVARDIRRLVLENRANGSIGTLEDRLKYVLEVALPTYLSQERPVDNPMVAYPGAPMAQRAFMLKLLSSEQ